MARFGDGLARDADVVRAAERAVAQALDGLSGAAPDLICLFIGGDQPDDAGAVAERVRVLCPGATVLGCSAAGVIGAGEGVELDRAVSVWAASLPGVRIRGFHPQGHPQPRGHGGRGHAGASARRCGHHPAGGPVLVPCRRLRRAGQRDLRRGSDGRWGMASGPRGPGSTRLLLDERVSDRGAVGVVLEGPVTVRALVESGLPTDRPHDGGDPVRRQRHPQAGRHQRPRPTRADRGGARPRRPGPGQRGTAVRCGDERVRRGARAWRVPDPQRAGGRPRAEGRAGRRSRAGRRTVRFQVRDAETAADDLGELLATFPADAGLRSVDGVLLVSCSGRGSRLFTTAGHDVQMVRHKLASSAVAGFFATGEIGPVAGRNHLHGFSAAILAFGEPR